MLQKICVCGAGTMGNGIAQVCAQSGFDTLLYDVNAGMLENAVRKIEDDLQLQVDKKRVSQQDRSAILKRLRCTNAIIDCAADVVIEAIAEKNEAKLGLFNQLSAINPPTTIFATNTSSLSVTAIAEKLPCPERVIGMHFFNPAPLMKLVEVVNSRYTNEATTRLILDLAGKMGKTPVLCNDAPGFIVNHVARPYYLEALHLLEDAIIDVDTMDKLLEASGFKMGPFRLMDLIGNDINYAVSCSVYEALGKPARLKPSFTQEQKVRDGALGRKTGNGYYQYRLNG